MVTIKKEKTTDVGKNVEKLEPMHKNCMAAVKKNIVLLLKIKVRITIVTVVV